MKNQKGFALVLALVLLVVMSLMGGALIVVSSGDHQVNNTSDNYEQTFYVAETALLEGERYLMNQHLGPWDISKSPIKRGKRNFTPANSSTVFNGAMTKKNYSKAADENKPWYVDTQNQCWNSFPAIARDTFKVVVAESWNFGVLLDDSINTSDEDEVEQISKLKNFYYEYFIASVGSADFSGAGASIKKSATDSSNKGEAYKIYGCGIYGKESRMVVALESSVVLPKQ